MSSSDSNSEKKKRRRSSEGGETKEERKERKRQKKEAKKAKKLEKKARRRSGQSTTTLPSAPTSGGNVASSIPSFNHHHLQQQENDESHLLFSKRHVRFTVSFLPSQLGQPNTVSGRLNKVKEYLNTHQWRKYSSFLQGILMHYSSVEFEQQKGGGCSGSILNELPYIHFDVKFTALLLTPKPGLTLDGVVSDGTVTSTSGADESLAIIEEEDSGAEMALAAGRHYSSHLSVLCFTFINASISGQDLRKAGFEFDNEMQQWCQKQSDGDSSTKKRFLVSGTKIRFCIDKIHESGGTVSLEGIKPVVVS